MDIMQGKGVDAFPEDYFMNSEPLPTGPVGCQMFGSFGFVIFSVTIMLAYPWLSQGGMFVSVSR